jgi:hypothetical protein
MSLYIIPQKFPFAPSTGDDGASAVNPVDNARALAIGLT